MRSGYRIPLRAACALAVSFVLAPPMARAEFTVGAKLPAFSMPGLGGATGELSFAEGTVRFAYGTESRAPHAVVVHLLQPDCLQCRAQLAELAILHGELAERGVLFVGIAHRGTAGDLQKLADDLHIEFPLLHGVGSPIAQQFAAGDTLGTPTRAA